MKTKIVLWGENEQGDKILLGIQLIAQENIIRINIIPEEDATEIFYNQMMNQWREGQKIPLPKTTKVIDRPLSMTAGLLPDEIKTQRQDILARAKTEWHFVVLSAKLYESYADEIQQIKERINELSQFDSGIWEEMKAFWAKVQNQVREKNLFREHASELRTKTNELFDTLKSLKKAMNDEFERQSKDHLDAFYSKLEDIEDRIEKGFGLQPIFNELKNIQSDFKNTSFTRKHHNDVWKRLDKAFKKVKEKRFGKPEPGASSAQIRLTRRYDGLIAAINKMEQSINRDVRDKDFQEKRISTTDGQLELQIRQAKMAMIEERLASKKAKLEDMLKTRGELEKRIEIEKEKAEQRKLEKEHSQKVKNAKEEVKKDIAEEIEQKANISEEQEEKLQKAAIAIKDSAEFEEAEKTSDESAETSDATAGDEQVEEQKGEGDEKEAQSEDFVGSVEPEVVADTSDETVEVDDTSSSKAPEESTEEGDAGIEEEQSEDANDSKESEVVEDATDGTAEADDSSSGDTPEEMTEETTNSDSESGEEE